MGKKPKVEEKSGGGESGSGRWMLTYLDMVTLLFGTFVLLYAMSNLDKKKFDAVAESLRMGFQGGGRTIFNERQIGGQTILDSLNPVGVKQRLLYQKLYGILKAERQKNIVNVREDERGLVISLAADVFFDSGSAELKESSRSIVDKITPLLVGLPNNIRIEGYTDDIPLGEKKNYAMKTYVDNWELAAFRAMNVLRYLQSSGVDTKKLSAQTFGDNRPLVGEKFYPKVGTPEARAFNRRVDIVVVTDPRDKVLPNTSENTEQMENKGNSEEQQGPESNLQQQDIDVLATEE